jgi:large subunit ribosomal protein L9
MANAIKIVLQQDVEHLGASGDVVRVRPGFARNYLIPRGLAVVATSASLSRVAELKRQAAARADAALAAAKELAVKLEASAVKLERAVGEDNRMYGSVTSRDIEEAFARLGVEVDRKKIELPEPIKTLGLHEVRAKVHTAVTAVLRVEVVKVSS